MVVEADIYREIRGLIKRVRDDFPFCGGAVRNYNLDSTELQQSSREDKEGESALELEQTKRLMTRGVLTRYGELIDS